VKLKQIWQHRKGDIKRLQKQLKIAIVVLVF